MQTHEIKGIKPNKVLKFEFDTNMCKQYFANYVKKRFFIPMPFKKNIPKSDIENILQMLAAAFINDFEQIQTACDDEILKNILYSGVWMHYAKLKQDEEKKDGDDKNAG